MESQNLFWTHNSVARYVKSDPRNPFGAKSCEQQNPGVAVHAFTQTVGLDELLAGCEPDFGPHGCKHIGFVTSAVAIDELNPSGGLLNIVAERKVNRE